MQTAEITGKERNVIWAGNDEIIIVENALPKEICEKCIETFDYQESMGRTVIRRPRDIENTMDGRQVQVSRDAHDSQLMDLNVLQEHGVETVVQAGFCDQLVTKALVDVVNMYLEKYTFLRNFPLSAPEVKWQKTSIGGGYHAWHAEQAYGLNRIFSWILYANDVEEGGETEFLYQGLRVKPKAGTIVLFGADYRHLHRGNPPLSGEKYIATGWINMVPS